MKKLMIVSLICLSSVAAQAESWKYDGKVWSCPKVQVSVPGGLKSSQDTDGSLTLEDDDFYLTVTPLADGATFSQFLEDNQEDLEEECSGLKWGKTLTRKEGEYLIEYREAKGVEDGVHMDCTVAIYSKGKQKVGVVSVVPLDSKDAMKMATQVVHSIHLK